MFFIAAFDFAGDIIIFVFERSQDRHLPAASCGWYPAILPVGDLVLQPTRYVAVGTCVSYLVQFLAVSEL